MKDLIRDIECYDCVVPLPRPLRVGAAVTSKRTYAVVRLRTEEGLDGLHRLLAGGLDAQDGCAVVPEGPGLGLAFDWDAVRSFARG